MLDPDSEHLNNEWTYSTKGCMVVHNMRPFYFSTPLHFMIVNLNSRQLSAQVFFTSLNCNTNGTKYRLSGDKSAGLG